MTTNPTLKDGALNSAAAFAKALEEQGYTWLQKPGGSSGSRESGKIYIEDILRIAAVESIGFNPKISPGKTAVKSTALGMLQITGTTYSDLLTKVMYPESEPGKGPANTLADLQAIIKRTPGLEGLDVSDREKLDFVLKTNLDKVVAARYLVENQAECVQRTDRSYGFEMRGITGLDKAKASADWPNYWYVMHNMGGASGKAVIDALLNGKGDQPLDKIAGVSATDINNNPLLTKDGARIRTANEYFQAVKDKMAGVGFMVEQTREHIKAKGSSHVFAADYTHEEKVYPDGTVKADRSPRGVVSDSKDFDWKAWLPLGGALAAVAGTWFLLKDSIGTVLSLIVGAALAIGGMFLFARDKMPKFLGGKDSTTTVASAGDGKSTSVAAVTTDRKDDLAALGADCKDALAVCKSRVTVGGDDTYALLRPKHRAELTVIGAGLIGI